MSDSLQARIYEQVESDPAKCAVAFLNDSRKWEYYTREELLAAAGELSLAPNAGQTLIAAAADVQAATPAAAMEIEPLREAWQELSRAVTELVEVAPPSDAVGPEIVKAYCPMVSAQLSIKRIFNFTNWRRSFLS